MSNFEKITTTPDLIIPGSAITTIKNEIIKNNYKILGNKSIGNKLEKIVDDMLKNKKVEDFSDFKNNLKDEIVKLSLEKIADNFGGSLSLYEDLEKQYYNIILKQARGKGDSFGENIDHDDFLDIVKVLNKKNILSKKIIGDLINSLMDN